MILCRFADQTAVQLPPQRRLIGMCSHRTAAGESAQHACLFGENTVHLSFRKLVLPGTIMYITGLDNSVTHLGWHLCL